MKLLELYSLSTGLKIGKQWLLEHFFPLPFSRYILLHGSAGMAGKCYPYYGLVVELIKPYLTKAQIEIVQFGGKDDAPIPGCHHIMGKDNMHQASYLVRNSLLLLGNDSVFGHRAGHLGIPLVQPWGPTSPLNHSALDANPEITTHLVSHRWGKYPTFAAQENPMSIALVDPFDVARAVLRLLKIEHTIPQKTLIVGQSFNVKMLELIPNVVPAPSFNPDLQLAVRMDLDHNEGNLAQTLQSGRKVNIVTKTPVNLNLVTHFKDSILSFNHEVDENTPREYVTAIRKLIKQHTFFTRTKDEVKLANIRFAFFDVTPIQQVVDRTRDDVEKGIREYTNDPTFSLDSALKLGTLKLKCQKYLLSKGKIYLSLAHERADLPTDAPEGDRVIDSEDLWRDMNHLFIYADR